MGEAQARESRLTKLNQGEFLRHIWIDLNDNYRSLTPKFHGSHRKLKKFSRTPVREDGPVLRYLYLNKSEPNIFPKLKVKYKSYISR